MQVKSIHFLPHIPGVPVYEMYNGDIRIPMPNKGTGQTLFLTFDEAKTGLVDKSDKNIKFLMASFADAKKSIIESNAKTLKIID